MLAALLADQEAQRAPLARGPRGVDVELRQEVLAVRAAGPGEEVGGDGSAGVVLRGLRVVHAVGAVKRKPSTLAGQPTAPLP